MLELDALLLRFLEKGYDGLPGELQAAFRKLLQEEDSRLFGWLIEAPHSVPREYAALIGPTNHLLHAASAGRTSAAHPPIRLLDRSPVYRSARCYPA